MKQMYASTVVQLEDVPVVHARGGQMRVLASPATIGATQLIMGHVLLQAGEEIKEHLHDYGEETVFVVRGQGTAFIEDIPHSIRENCLFIARKGERHRVVNEGPGDMELVFATAPLAPRPEIGHREV
ncbi:cupin domain-containing protein [Paenibacillus tritici]|jgi:putative monooxygenase|uniref:Cupin domain-containing protein n=1 Tax=Paenibacillus tritici TaxID=1873425 RepID=A0ABX2DWR1_9BACL|nr:cupin domain-containing protein [Paenibacillus tritici]NQX49140.1 cupin domain-containing protein [Paenibacillus tritici]QUL56045.1 cupin domain-containing protein [Paenibacillus tritici]